MTDRTQLDWLASDNREFRRLLDEHPNLLDVLADVRDPNRHATYLVVVELTWRLWIHAMGVEVLLREELYTSALVLQRAMFDAFVTLGTSSSTHNSRKKPSFFWRILTFET